GAGRDPVIEYEIAYDDNRPGDAMALVSTSFEQMVRFKPAQDGYQLLRLRALLAQEGRVRWTVYAQDRLEQPGEVLASWTRDYARAMASGLADGRWGVEDLGERVAGRHWGPVWVGFRKEAGAPRLWSSGIDCENAFVRDVDPSRYLRPMQIRKTPMIRLDWRKP